MDLHSSTPNSSLHSGISSKSSKKSRKKTSSSNTVRSRSSSPKWDTSMLKPPSVGKIPQKLKSRSSISSNYAEIELKMPTQLSDKLNYNAAVAKKMDKIFQSFNNVEPFIGSFYLSNLFYLYLFKKYKTECSFIDQNEKWLMQFSLDISNHSKEIWYNDFIEFQTDTIKRSAKYVSKCIISGINIMIIPLSIQTTHGGHANILIYRRNTGVIEHFEPHGNKYGGKGHSYVVKMLSSYLDQFVKLVNSGIKIHNLEEGGVKLPKITLVKAHNVCPVIYGVQSLEQQSAIPKNAMIEPAGYCEAWSMFFTELCLKNPEMSSREIYDAVMEKTELYENENDYLRNIIRGYTSYINNKISKHFSRVFDEPITSAKVREHVDSMTNSRLPKTDATRYYDKLLEIMEVESKTTFFGKNQQYPDVKERYNEFTRNIQPETSSSSIKSEDRVESPKRKSLTTLHSKKTKAVTKKVSHVKLTTEDKLNKKAFSELMKNHQKNISIKKQQEKEEKASAKILAKEEKETEKQRIKDEKQRIKDEKAFTKSEKIKPVSKAKTAKNTVTNIVLTEDF